MEKKKMLKDLMISNRQKGLQKRGIVRCMICNKGFVPVALTQKTCKEPACRKALLSTYQKKARIRMKQRQYKRNWLAKRKEQQQIPIIGDTFKVPHKLIRTTTSTSTTVAPSPLNEIQYSFNRDIESVKIQGGKLTVIFK